MKWLREKPQKRISAEVGHRRERDARSFLNDEERGWRVQGMPCIWAARTARIEVVRFDFDDVQRVPDV